jgi:hypothetical protein
MNFPKNRAVELQNHARQNPFLRGEANKFPMIVAVDDVWKVGLSMNR